MAVRDQLNINTDKLEITGTSKSKAKIMRVVTSHQVKVTLDYCICGIGMAQIPIDDRVAAMRGYKLIKEKSI